MTRLLTLATPAAGDVADAAELTRAAAELGPLLALILGASVVLVFLFRGVFGWLTEREKRLAAQPKPAGRNNTPPAGTPGVGLLTELHASEERIRAFIRPLDDRIRMLEQKESSSSAQLAGLRAEISKDMDAFSKASAAQSEAIQELTNVVTGLRAQLDYATRTSFGNPKTGG